ncbi:MAG: putative metal-binding motif-containing protein [Nanoarchaeota archaeon]|nr:putative metal-binding motif-containing protein [Nanoarchaeota archaeon]MBU0977391.1 putative metal-binding motif-containing protein [Nanoarchaeota archaeon]
MQKRGLSNIVITVLVVLVSLIAVAIVWSFLRPVFTRSGVEFQTSTLCSEIDLSPQKCLRFAGAGGVRDEGGVYDKVVVRVKVDRGVVAGFLATVEYNDQTFLTKELEETIETYETRAIDTFTSYEPGGLFPVKARATALVKLDSGEIVPCTESDITVMCGVGTGSGGDSPCVSNSDCPANHVCTDGVCTFYSNDDGYCTSDADCDSGYVCRSGYCAVRSSPGGGGGGGGDGGDTGCEDGDGDGYSAASCGGSDCNDGNSAVHPGASENCGNEVDDNCNGLTDLDDEECDLSCPDDDVDGYQDEACGGTDCDDGDDGIHPEASENCGNGVDDDCNGLIDGADPQCAGPICVDGDSDGYDTCDPAEGGDTLPADCDDGDEFVNPGVIETYSGGGPVICSDHTDNDCDGVVDETPDCPSSCDSLPFMSWTCSDSCGAGYQHYYLGDSGDPCYDLQCCVALGCDEIGGVCDTYGIGCMGSDHLQHGDMDCDPSGSTFCCGLEECPGECGSGGCGPGQVVYNPSNFWCITQGSEFCCVET